MSYNPLLLTLGFFIVATVAFDVFQAVIVPRMTSRRLRIAPFLVGGSWWSFYRAVCRDLPEKPQNALLNFFGPFAFIMLFVIWFSLLIAGIALMLFALRNYTQPILANFIEAAYFAGTSVLTLGFGDVVASHWSTKFIVLSAAMLGIVMLGLQVSYLFTLQSYLQQREQVVNTLNSRAGAPASGLVLLLRYMELGILPSLPHSFIYWENWVATIAESHGSFPLLLYFRSYSSSNSWVSSIGAICDAAALLSTSVENVSVGEANLFYWLAVKTLKPLAGYLELKPIEGAHLTQEEYEDGLKLLESAGYTVKQDRQMAWKRFSEQRSGYMQYLVPLSDYFLIPLQIWTIQLHF